MRLFVSLFSVIFLLACTLHAQSMHSPDALLQGEILSDQYENAVGFRYNVPGITGLISGSAVMLNSRFGLTAAHNFTQGSLTSYNHKVYVGANLFNPERVVDVIEWDVYPTWSGQVSGQQIDLAWFKIAEPLDVPTLEIASASVGDVITYVGYGRPATPITGYYPYEGERRGFETRLDGFGAPGGIAQFYLEGLFRRPGLTLSRALGGGGTPGSSGSPGFSSSGELISILALQSGAPNYGMASYGIHLSYGDIPQWITDNTTLPPDREPCYRRAAMPTLLALCKASLRPKFSTTAVACRFPDC